MTIIIIPARLAAVRLPEKPLADINGKPMILRVWERAMASKVGEVVVACDSDKIASVITAAGGKAVITHPDIPSGSDRVKAALDIFDPSRNHDMVINLQGDMPDVSPDALHASLEAAKSADIGTCAYRIEHEEERDNPNFVKVAFAAGGRALYFSRSRIPHGEGELYCHIGVYCFKRASLDSFVKLPPSTLEKRERLEQLRAMESGMSINVGIISSAPISVDTPDDLAAARSRIIRD